MAMTSWTRTLLIPKADTYFWKLLFLYFFFFNIISYQLVSSLESNLSDNTVTRPLESISQAPGAGTLQTVEEVLRSTDLAFTHCSSFFFSFFFFWKGFSASAWQSEITHCRTEVVLIVIFFFAQKLFLSAEVNPCHFPSCRSEGVVFLQNPNPDSWISTGNALRRKRKECWIAILRIHGFG